MQILSYVIQKKSDRVTGPEWKHMMGGKNACIEGSQSKARHSLFFGHHAPFPKRDIGLLHIYSPFRSIYFTFSETVTHRHVVINLVVDWSCYNVVFDPESHVRFG